MDCRWLATEGSDKDLALGSNQVSIHDLLYGHDGRLKQCTPRATSIFEHPIAHQKKVLTRSSNVRPPASATDTIGPQALEQRPRRRASTSPDVSHDAMGVCSCGARVVDFSQAVGRI